MGDRSRFWPTQTHTHEVCPGWPLEPRSKLAVKLISNEPQPRTIAAAASVVIAPTGGEWRRGNFTLPAAGLTCPNSSLEVSLTGGSVLLLDAVLLEPAAEHRWRGHHIRKDIGDAIADAGLRFMRFGGDMAESNERLPFGHTPGPRRSA